MTTDGTLLLGLVSISDRASQGVYQDEGLPALDWLAKALLTPFKVETRLIRRQRSKQR